MSSDTHMPSHDEMFTLTGPDGSIVEILREGEHLHWDGYADAGKSRGNGIGGCETWTNPSVAALRIAADLADEEGYRLTGHDGHPDTEDADPDDEGEADD